MFDIKTYFPKSFETLQSIDICICHKHQEFVLQLLYIEVHFVQFLVLLIS